MSYEHTFSPKRLWTMLGAGMLVSLSVLLYYGGQIYQKVPPFPFDVVNWQGEVVFSDQQMLDGQDVWRSLGGMEMGTIWGHGSYLAPDWTADWIQKESELRLNRWALREHGMVFSALNEELQAGLTARLQTEIRENTFDPHSNRAVISSGRAEAIRQVIDEYDQLFSDDINAAELREQYALNNHPLPDAQHREGGCKISV